MRTAYEVVIAGGGPAGSACAAAILGRRPDLAGRVLVLDRARHPRAKPCGGGLTGHVPGAMAALGLRLEVPSVPSTAAQVIFGAARRRVVLPQPVRIVRREEFDRSLLRQAEARGAVVHEGLPLRGFTVEDGGVTVAAGTGAPVRARILVGADGAGSLVRKRLLGHREQGGPRPLRLFRAELPTANPLGEEMVYDFTPMTDGLRGYLWLFPVPGGRVNVGVMHYPAPGEGLSGAQLTALCARHLLRYGVRVPDGALRGWPAWGYDPRQPLSAPHLCLVGDAAGIDALTGEGIAVALEMGEVAGAAVCEALTSGDLRLKDYGRRVRRAAVGRELALDRLLGWLLYDHPSQPAGAGAPALGAWRRWLGMVLYDEELLGLYAQRVAGALVLADQRWRLLRVLLRQLPAAARRQALLEEAVAAVSAGAPP